MKSTKRKVMLGAGITLGIILIFVAGYVTGAGLSTHLILNMYRDVSASDVYEQIGILTTLRDDQIEEAIDALDRRVINGLYSSTTSTPKGLSQDISQWPDPVLRCWQKAKAYYEEHPEVLQQVSLNYPGVRELLEKVPESQHRILEKDFARIHTGKTSPPLHIAKWFGSPVTLEELHGKVVLLDFWGAWCGPCLRRLPHIQELYNKYNKMGLEVIGIHSLRKSETADEFLSKNNYTFLIGIDTGETAHNYAVTVWPTYYLIDKQGQLIWGPKHSPPSEKQIESLLKD
jgi:thiol-disulfide isomerase/thioredoxin